MRLVYLILIFCFMQNLTAQSKVEKVLPEKDTVVLEDYGLILPKWQVSINSIGNFRFFGVYAGLRAELDYRFNDILTSTINLNENYNAYYGIGGDFLTTDYSFDFYYLLFNKNKNKSAFFLKNFYNKKTNAYFKPKITIKKKKQLKIGLGLMNKCVRDELIPVDGDYFWNTKYINGEYVTSIDYVFNEDDLEFDYDGFINELQAIKYFNQYSVKLGINYSINKNYKFSIEDKKVRKYSLNEYYCSLLIGIFQNGKYENKKENFDIKNNFTDRVEFKRIGGTLGAKHTIKNININYEIGILPNYVFTNSFYQELLLLEDPWSNYLNFGVIKQRHIYTQFSIGYTFGQKIKLSK